MKKHEKLNYVEFPARDLAATKSFFTNTFKWTFTDYGDEYSAFTDEGLDGGFYKAENSSQTSNGAALLIFYSANIEDSLNRVKANGGHIVREVFNFPGGCRFHFKEPSGNEFAVWSESRSN